MYPWLWESSDTTLRSTVAARDPRTSRLLWHFCVWVCFSFTTACTHTSPAERRWEFPVSCWPRGNQSGRLPEPPDKHYRALIYRPALLTALDSQLHSNTHRNLQEANEALPSRGRFVFEYNIRKQARRRRTRCALGGTLQSLNKGHLFLMMRRHTDRNWTSVNYWTSRETETSKCLEQMWESLGSSGGKTWAWVSPQLQPGTRRDHRVHGFRWTQRWSCLVNAFRKLRAFYSQIPPPPFSELTLPKSHPF